MNSFLFQWSILLSLICSLTCLDYFAQEFFPHELDNKATIDHFLTGIQIQIAMFGHVKVKYCTNLSPPQYRLGNCKSQLTLNYLMTLTRTRNSSQHGVWYQFDSEVILGIPNNSFISDAMQNEYSNISHFSVPVVKGPTKEGIDIKLVDDPKALLELQTHANYVLMFAETVNATDSFYSKKQIQEMSTMVKKYALNYNIHVAFDVYYLSRTDPFLLDWDQNFPKTGVLFYSIKNQPTPDYVQLKEIIKNISGRQLTGMRFFVDDDLRTRYKSFLPTVEWQFYPDQMKVPLENLCQVPIDMLMVYQFIRSPREMRMVLLGDDTMDMVHSSSGQYPADILLQHLESGRNQRPLLIEFRNNESIKTINFDRYPATPFVILPVVEGPNRPSDIKIPSITSLVSQGMKANFVIGFVETCSGPEMGYSEKNILELVTSLTHPSVKNRKMGIRLQAKHLGHAKGIDRLQALCLVVNLKWIFILDDCGRYSPSEEQLENLKFNLNLLCNRSIYLFVNEETRRGIYHDETIMDPFPPETFATPSTTTAITIPPETPPPTGPTFPVMPTFNTIPIPTQKPGGMGSKLGFNWFIIVGLLFLLRVVEI